MSTAVAARAERTTSTEGLTQESAFEVLSCRRRRNALHYLLQRHQPTELRELATQLAAWENDVSVAEVTYKQRMRLYTALRQSHLPKMDERGVVEFDANRGTVSLTDEASELEVYLDVVPHDEIRWSKYYLVLGVLCGGLVAAAAVGVAPFAQVPGLAVAAAVTGLFVVSAVAHSYHDVQNRLGSDGEPPA